VELPVLGEWTFTPEDAARIKQPVLAVLGADSAKATGLPFFDEGHGLLLEWLPQAKPFLLPHAAHSLQMENPHDMAIALADFLASV
jgi:pimeloyl-ACP methyl ester carboxylesterase